jgi:glycosyltransferase involved in cell wall biosynthesis
MMVDSDLFVLSSYSENFGISAVEAMYCQLPVILANQVGIAEDIQKAQAGIVFDIEKEELADCILQCIQNPDQTKQMKEKGYRFAGEQYDIDVVSNQVNSLVHSIQS